MKLSRILYRAARTSRDVEAISSGDPKKIARRAAFMPWRERFPNYDPDDETGL